MPTAEQMLMAAEWLDVNEGEGDEGKDCHAVAEWLRKQAAKADAADQVRRLVKATGCTPRRARIAYRRALKDGGPEFAKVAVKIIATPPDSVVPHLTGEERP